jgi:hypothetical protein
MTITPTQAVINRGDTMRIRDILADIAGVAALAILTLSPLAL